MAERYQHATCTWPNGEARRVRYATEDGFFRPGMNSVLWVEHCDGFDTVCFESVPYEWLSELGLGNASRSYNSS